MKKLGGLDPCQPGAFTDACRVLESNYGDIQEQKASSFQLLLNLPYLYELDYQSLEDFADALRLAVGQLQRLGEPDSTLDGYVYAIWPRLPITLREAIQDERVKASRPPIPPMADLQASIDRKLKAIRASVVSNGGSNNSGPYAGTGLLGAARQQPNHPHGQPGPGYGFQKPNPAFGGHRGAPGSPHASHGSNQAPQKFSRECPFCDDVDHGAFACGRVAKPEYQNSPGSINTTRAPHSTSSSA